MILLLNTATVAISVPVLIPVSFAQIRTFRKGVLVIMHPDLKNPSFNPNLTAKPLQRIFTTFLHFPPNFLREFLHLLLLLLRKLGPEPLPGRVTPRPDTVRLAQCQEHVGCGCGPRVVGRRDRRRGLRPAGRRWWWRVVAVVGAVLEYRRNGCGKRWILRLPAVEVAVAAASGALQGGRVSSDSSGRWHELAAAVERVAAHAGGVVLKTFLVREAGRRWRMEFKDTVDGYGFYGMDLCRRSIALRLHWGWFPGCGGGGGGGSCHGGYVHLVMLLSGASTRN